MGAPRDQSPPDRAEDPGYTAQGEAAEQSAFRGEGEYSGGGFAGGPEEPADDQAADPTED